MIGVAYMTVHVSHMTGLREIDACFDMITQNGARSLHIQDYGIRVGNPANLVTLPAQAAFQALRYQVIPNLVVSQGKVIARNQPSVMMFTGG
jgi:cytosine deaminase